MNFNLTIDFTLRNDFVDFIVKITLKCKRFFLFAIEQELIYQYNDLR